MPTKPKRKDSIFERRKGDASVEVRRDGGYSSFKGAEKDFSVKREKTSLGLKSKGSIDAVDRITEGLPITAWDHFVRFSGLSVDEISEVVMLPLRTLSRRRGKGKLEPAESDRLMRFSGIVEKAMELFEGDVNGARHWLRSPQAALGGRTPIRFSQTTVGAREVEDLIGRLERGVYT
jgi:putative toxin-antitoxin system antitoxin component (TIGR02293 family)